MTKLTGAQTPLKICNACRQWKDRSLFSPNNRASDGYHYRCKACVSAQVSAYQATEAGKAARKRWRESRRTGQDK